MTRRTRRGNLVAFITRDRAIFSVGLVGAINEVFIRSGPERPTILAFLAGMMGLPVFLKWDDRSTKGDDPTERREES